MALSTKRKPATYSLRLGTIDNHVLQKKYPDAAGEKNRSSKKL